MTQNILFYIQSVVTHIINVWRQSMYANKCIRRYHFYICWSDKDTSFVIRLDLLDLLTTLIDDEYLLAHSVTCPLLQNVDHSRFIGYHFINFLKRDMMVILTTSMVSFSIIQLKCGIRCLDLCLPYIQSIKEAWLNKYAKLYSLSIYFFIFSNQFFLLKWSMSCCKLLIIIEEILNRCR